MGAYGTDALQTIKETPEESKVSQTFSSWPVKPTFEVPEVRMKDARASQDFFKRLADNDTRRSRKRALVNGLVDGNPPYKRSKLLGAGRADACNVNWGTGRSYLESGTGSFYDLATQAPSIITFRTAFGRDDGMKELWSNIASQEADRVFQQDPVWDYEEQISQWEMVLHGCGPLFFEDEMKVLPRAIQCGDLKVPEFTKSDTHYWEAGGIQIDYYPPELYAFIRDEAAATARGWNVEFTKRVISRAMDVRTASGVMYEWEYYQQEIKNNSLSYYDDSKICRVVHLFWKEFDGRISQGIVERESQSGLAPEYLFIHAGRYKNFPECTHPMYFDHGNGGRHHSVTGLGVKMYSAMEYENRLICNLCDKAFSPKMLFTPTTTLAANKFEMISLGDYGVLPQGTNVTQTGIAGLMDDGLAMRATLSDIFQKTLSNYKQGVQQKSGNPVTKFEKQVDQAMQSALSMPQFNRYYRQRDSLMQEIWRRLANPNSTDDRAIEFQKRCKARSVPVEALCRPEYVGATRIVGQGTAFMRSQALDNLIGSVGGSLPEEGLANLTRDKIAAEAGQGAVTRYFPVKQQGMPTDQQADAMQWVAAMKIGVPPLVTSSQNAVTHAGTYLKAASDSLQSLPQGGNPMEVLSFLELCGPAIAAQLKRFAQDPLRAKVFQAMEQQWKQIAGAVDKLKDVVKKQQAKSAEQQKKTQQAMSDQQLAQAKTAAAIKDKQVKTQAQLRQSEEKHRLKMTQGVQDLALKDASAASTIHINRLKSLQETNGDGE